MMARLSKLFDYLAQTVWLVPALIVFSGAPKAMSFVQPGRSGIVPRWLLERLIIRRRGNWRAYLAWRGRIIHDRRR